MLEQFLVDSNLKYDYAETSGLCNLFQTTFCMCKCNLSLDYFRVTNVNSSEQFKKCGHGSVPFSLVPIVITIIYIFY